MFNFLVALNLQIIERRKNIYAGYRRRTKKSSCFLGKEQH